MELNFICPHHEHLVIRDEAQASNLWHGLSAQGKTEAKHEYWAKAASFFGSATEIALLRASVSQGQGQLEYLNMSIYSARWLIEAFCRLDDLKMAHDYLEMTERNISRLLKREPKIKNSLFDDKKVIRSIEEFFHDCRANITQHKASNFEHLNAHIKIVGSRANPITHISIQ